GRRTDWPHRPPARWLRTAPLSPRDVPPYLVDVMTPYDEAAPQVQASVTDRCDLRCIYCMAEHMTFLPKAEVLTLEELDRLASAFVSLGVRKLRLTGGEPLVRKGIMTLVEGL